MFPHHSIDNNKYFLSTSQYIRMISEGSCETGVMMLKIQLCHHRNKLHFELCSNRKELFEIVIMFHNITNITEFFIKLIALVTVKNLTNLKLFNCSVIRDERILK